MTIQNITLICWGVATYFYLGYCWANILRLSGWIRFPSSKLAFITIMLFWPVGLMMFDSNLSEEDEKIEYLLSQTTVELPVNDNKTQHPSPSEYHYIRTYTGRHFCYEGISPEMIDINDIAQALSNICRFCGQLDNFYSVAQHSVLVSYLVPKELALEALLHDASEAYCQDIPAPLKALLPDYRDIERLVDMSIRCKFGLPLDHSCQVKHSDLVMLATERRDLDIDDGDQWAILEGIKPTNLFEVHPLNPCQARSLFMARFKELLPGGCHD